MSLGATTASATPSVLRQAGQDGSTIEPDGIDQRIGCALSTHSPDVRSRGCPTPTSSQRKPQSCRIGRADPERRPVSRSATAAPCWRGGDEKVIRTGGGGRRRLGG